MKVLKVERYQLARQKPPEESVPEYKFLPSRTAKLTGRVQREKREKSGSKEGIFHDYIFGNYIFIYVLVVTYSFWESEPR